jgi:hypothetical protein
MSQRTQPASWIADEYGGSYLNNPEQQNRDLRSANGMAILIQQMVRDRGGGQDGYRRAGELINETLDELSARAPFGFVSPAFALGMTQVLLEKANGMNGQEFLGYLDNIRDRDNPLFFWQRSTLDPLFEEVKGRTRAHVEEIYGKSSFTVFDAMKGQSGPLAFAAGYADALLDEVGSTGRPLLLGAANPLEVGRQTVEMMRNLDRVPQVLQQVVREADQLIQASTLDDYHKGFLAVKISLIALDAVDVVEAGMAIGNLARRMRGKDINGIDDALQALDEGPQQMRQRGQAGNANDLAQGDLSARSRTPTASPSAQATELTNQLIQGLPENYREPYREAFTQLLRANNYDTPQEVAGFARWLNDNPNHAVTQRYHEIAQETMQQRMVSSYPDKAEFAYQRALNDTFRDAKLTTPQDRMAYLDAFNGPNAAAFRTALDERALGHVVDHSLRNIPPNARDAYRASLASILSEQGYLGQGRFDPGGAQGYLDRLAGAPGGPAAMAVHNRAMNVVVNTAADRFPDGTEGYYARAYRQTFQAENIGNPSAAQRYIDNLNAAPNGPAMRAVTNRAIGNIVHDVVDDMPRNVQAAYSRALRLSLDQAGADTPAEALSFARNLGDGRQVQSIAALHHRAFDSVIQSALSSQMDAPTRTAYTQALREALDASGNGPVRGADGRASYNFNSVENAQRYVINLATSPESMQRIHDRAGELLGRGRTPDRPGNGDTPTPDVGSGQQPPNPPRPPRTGGDTPTPDAGSGQQPPNPPRPPRTGGDTPTPDAGGGQQPPNPPRPPTTGGPDDRPDRPNRPDDDTPTPRQPTTLDFARPRAFQHNGQSWDIAGVNTGTPPSLSLITENAVPRFVPRDALLPRTPNGDLAPREVSLVQLDGNRSVTSSETYQVIGVEKKGLKIARDGANGERIEHVIPFNDPNQEVRFAFPGGGSYAARQNQYGSVRFDPVDPQTTTVQIVPGMQFEARLQGRELEGPRLIAMNPQGELFVANPLRTPEIISARDIAPTWQKVPSSTAPNVDLYMDSARHRQAGLRSGRDGEALEPINTLNGDHRISHGFANQIYRPVLDALRNPATTGDVSIAMYAFGTSLDGRRYTEALLDYAQRNPNSRITVHSGDVTINGRRGEELNTWLADRYPNITITEPLPPSNFRVPHEKIVAIGDQVFVSSEKMGMAMSRKIGFMAEIGGEDARLMHQYIQQLGDRQAPRIDPSDPNSPRGPGRAELVDRLAEHGILIDDPVAGRYPNAAAMQRTIAEAQQSLRIFQSEITDVEAARSIARRSDESVAAGRPLNIDVKYRDIDTDSERILNEAAARNPNLKHQLVPSDTFSPIYQHENFVLSERGGVLTSGFMWEPKSGQVPRYTSGGEGGVMLDADQARQYSEFIDRQPTRQRGPASLLNRLEEHFKNSDLWPQLWQTIERLQPRNRDRAADPDAAPSIASLSNANASPASLERGSTLAALSIPPMALDAASSPRPPQSGEPNYLAYAQSGDAVARLNAKLNLDPSQQPQLQESTEKLRVAAATLAVNEGRRVDAIDLNKAAPNLPAGSLAFVIEQQRNGDTERFGTIKIQEVMQATLGEGYQKLASATLNPELQAAQNNRESELARQSARSANLS